jgi:hypothetical protein
VAAAAIASDGSRWLGELPPALAESILRLHRQRRKDILGRPGTGADGARIGRHRAVWSALACVGNNRLHACTETAS